MKNLIKSVGFLAVFLIVFTLPSLTCFAQGGPDDPATDPDAPIDGGVGILIATGVGYGVKKYRDSKKQNILDEDSVVSDI